MPARNRTFLTVLFGLLVLLAVPGLRVRAGAAGAAGPAELDAFVRQVMRVSPISGMAVSVVKGDQLVFEKGYGTANRAGDPVTPHTPFMIASATKSFTALAVQQLVLDGRLGMDDPVSDYVPEFRLADPDKAARITVRHLLDHTSGISRQEGSEPYLHSPATTTSQALDRLARFNPTNQPGEVYDYSNWNYVLLGLVIERASGQPYAGYMQSRVLEPLQMHATTLEDPTGLPGYAVGHRVAFGFLQEHPDPFVPVMLSAGYLTSTAEDLSHYMLALLNDGQYQDVQLIQPPAQETGWFDVHWYWHKGLPGAINFSHSGAHNGINSTIMFLPMQKVGVAVLMNTRLDQLAPATDAAWIAYNLARLAAGYPVETVTDRGYRMRHVLYDGIGILLILGIAVQAARLKGWPERFRASRGWKRAARLAVLAADLALGIAALLLPGLMGTTWPTVLYNVPHLSGAILAVGVGLVLMGVIKLGLLLRGNPRQPVHLPDAAGA